MKSYKPSGACSLPSFFLISMATFGAAILTGILAHLIGNLIYLIILFPLLMGAAVGKVFAISTKKWKCRNMAIAITIVISGGLLSYVTMHFADYVAFTVSTLDVLKQEVSEDGTPYTAEEAAELVDAFLMEEGGSASFIGFMRYSAKEGVSIGKVGRDGGNIGEAGTWFYWTAELGLILFIVVTTGMVQMKIPFCESCENWYDDEHLGTSDSMSSDDIIRSLDEENYENLKKSMVPTDSYPLLKIVGSRCRNCDKSDPVVKLVTVTVNSKGAVNEKVYHQQHLEQSRYTRFIETIQSIYAEYSTQEELLEENES